MGHAPESFRPVRRMSGREPAHYRARQSLICCAARRVTATVPKSRERGGAVIGDPFGAAASAVGYLYQCKYALLAALERMDGRPLLVEVESLDDIAFPQEEAPLELLQLKHHQGAEPPSLTTASKDLWSSLRVWIARLASGDLLEDARLFLITTVDCAVDSAPALLRATGRDVERAHELLLAYAMNSGAESTKGGRVAFRELGLPQRLWLLDRILVIDSEPLIDDLDESLNQKLRFVRPSKVDYVRDLMVEWWYRRCAEQLSGKAPGPIASSDIDMKIEAIGDALSADNLPLDVPEPHEGDLGDFTDRVFARQLGLLPVSSSRVLQAAKDYMQAFTQRSRWLGSELLTIGDLTEYERRLVSEWRRRFNVMCDELGASAAAEEMQREARALYKWVELEAEFPIRPRCTAAFVTRGSFQILSDQMRVGWHPRFEEMLAAALDEESA